MIAGIPCDAEVEYLQTPAMTDTGQYTTRIDTGISPTVDTEVFLDFLFINELAGDQTCASRTGTTTANRFFVFSSSSGGRVVLGNWTKTNLGLVGQKRHTILFNEYQTHHYYIDGVDKGAMGYTQYTKGNDNHLLLFATSGYEPSYGTSNSRIYSCRIRVGGVLVRDFIPVRVGSGANAVGYMYDRVTRRLFGNLGTGAFVLGPDVAKPVMALRRMAPVSAMSYVQNGLVAMWDGIENAGWGVHDASATTWKDLVGNADLPCAYGSVSDLWVRYSSSYQITIDNPLITGYELTIEGVYDRSETAGNFSAIGFGYSTARLCTANASAFGCRFSSVYNTISVAGAKNSVSWLRSAADGNYMRLYADGQDKGLFNNPQNGDVTTNNKLSINGENPYGNYRNIFSVGSIRIYNRALTAAEIAYNYNIDKLRFNLPQTGGAA